MFTSAEIDRTVIAAAIEVHRHLGPGLVESTYEDCLAHELGRRHLQFLRQPFVSVRYKGLFIEKAFRPETGSEPFQLFQFFLVFPASVVPRFSRRSEPLEPQALSNECAPESRERKSREKPGNQGIRRRLQQSPRRTPEKNRATRACNARFSASAGLQRVSPIFSLRSPTTFFPTAVSY